MVRWFAIAALVLLIVAFAIARLGIDFGPQLIVVHRSHAPGTTAVGLISDLAVLLFAISLVQLIRLLGRLSSGTMFAPSVTGAFRTFAFWLMLAAVVAIGGPLVAGTAAAVLGEAHPVEVRINLRDVMFVIAGMVMFLVARMLDEAARIEAELEEIV